MYMRFWYLHSCRTEQRWMFCVLNHCFHRSHNQNCFLASNEHSWNKLTNGSVLYIFPFSHRTNIIKPGGLLRKRWNHIVSESVNCAPYHRIAHTMIKTIFPYRLPNNWYKFILTFIQTYSNKHQFSEHLKMWTD